jgi:glycosyltransferase involved in cell wall biosynthesis
MQKLVDELVCTTPFDFIHADQLTMLQFSLHSADRSAGAKPKVILDAHNAVWTIVEQMQRNASWMWRPFLGTEVRRLKQYEASLLAVVDRVLVTTELDRQRFNDALKELKTSANKHIAPIRVIPIAVGTGELQPIQRKPGAKNIVTLGTLHYPPNADGIRWFLYEVLPRIRRSVPNVRLTVIGKSPPADFLDLALRHPDVIRLTGYVPDLIPYLEDSSLMVVPVRAGGGMRVRILEAFAYGMPVVTTTVGLEGIQAKPGKDVLVADSPADFADSVIRLLNDDSLQSQLSKNGRLLAETRYDWKVVLKELDSVYR